MTVMRPQARRQRAPPAGADSGFLKLLMCMISAEPARYAKRCAVAWWERRNLGAQNQAQPITHAHGPGEDSKCRIAGDAAERNKPPR